MAQANPITESHSMQNKVAELFNEQRHTDMAEGATYLKKYQRDQDGT